MHPRSSPPIGCRLDASATSSTVLARAELATLARSVGSHRGWLTCSADGDLQIAMSSADVDAARGITATCLAAAGLIDSDRVVVALNNDGAGVGVLWSEAAAQICAAATVTRPDGTRRLLGRLAAADATALICTPTAARQLADFVTRDPDADPGVRRVVLVGEIVGRTDAATIRRSLRCLVSEVWPDPVFGVALAWRDALTSTSFRRGDPRLISTAPITETAAEWIVHPRWAEQLGGISYRSGVVSASSDPSVLDRPRWTTGDQLLVRGRWFSCGSLERTLDSLGIHDWQLRIERQEAAERIELVVDDPTPIAPIAEALRAITPLRVEVRHAQLPERAARLHDARGHHLDQPFTSRPSRVSPRS